MALERLAPELLCSILASLDSPQDLYSLIKASPASLRVFLASRRITFSSIIRNAFLPDAIHHALALLHVPKVPETDDMESQEVEAFSREVKEYLSQYFQPNPWSFPTDFTNIITLIRLIARIARFTSRYFDYAMKTMDIEQDSCLWLLSSTETARLQRAFLRFEVYCRICPALDGEAMLSTGFQFDYFINKMEPWEVEEICCVLEFLRTVVRRDISELEDKFVQTVLGNPHLQTRNVAELQKHPSRRHYEDGMAYFDIIDLTPLTMFSTHTEDYRPEIVLYIVSLGLGFLDDMMASDQPRGWEIIQSNLSWRDFLIDALGRARHTRHTTVANAVLSPPEGDFTDSGSRPNKGWFEFNNSYDMWSVGQAFSNPTHGALRICGYMFWDSRRLLYSSVHKALTTLEDGEGIVMRLYGPELGGVDEESAEEQLEYFQLPRAELEKIWVEFGCPT
ncbi:hypothetical protein F4678DRAFT_477274 [Xylaria arbuscula]|nr:hypothetical protein F4678DRAFT_477274 [Xylaria arbuscula]